MAFKSRRIVKQRSVSSLRNYPYEKEEDMTESTCATSSSHSAILEMSLSSISMNGSNKSHTKRERPPRKRCVSPTRICNKLNRNKASISRFLSKDKPSERPTAIRQNSFRPNDSIVDNDLEGLDALDLSLASLTQTQTAGEGTTEDRGLVKTASTNNNKQRSGPPKRQVGGIMTKFVEARVHTFLWNMETIRLMLIGE